MDSESRLKSPQRNSKQRIRYAYMQSLKFRSFFPTQYLLPNSSLDLSLHEVHSSYSSDLLLEFREHGTCLALQKATVIQYTPRSRYRAPILTDNSNPPPPPRKPLHPPFPASYSSRWMEKSQTPLPSTASHSTYNIATLPDGFYHDNIRHTNTASLTSRGLRVAASRVFFAPAAARCSGTARGPGATSWQRLRSPRSRRWALSGTAPSQKKI